MIELKNSITILCSNYNSKEWIDGYLQSVNNQSLEMFDIVFVDAASTDDSLEAIKNFEFRQGIGVKIIELDYKASITEAWNIAIKNSDTEFVINLNTDDKLFQHSLATYSYYISRFPADIYYSPAVVVGDKEHRQVVDYLNWPEHSHDTLLRFCYCGPFPLLRKSAVEVLGLFDEKYIYSFDYDMWLKMSYNGLKFYRIDTPLGTYYRNPVGNSTKPENLKAAQAEDREIQAKYKKAPLLSILVCTLESRKPYLERLEGILAKQHDPRVEVLICSDNRQSSIGTKRNILLDNAKGDYIVFIDDDDVVSDNYIELILKALENKPDVIGIHLLMTTDGQNECRTYHSLKYDSWWDEPDPDRLGLRRYYRNPNHLNPVKRELALQVKFPEISMGEDKDYSMRLKDLLKTEVYIEEPIYYYEFISNK